MRLVDDQGVVALEPGIALEFPQQQPVGHEFHERAGAGAVRETYLVADEVAGCRAQFGAQAVRERLCGDAPRLGMANESRDAAPHLQADPRNLRALAAARRTAHDDDRVLGDRRGNRAAPCMHGQGFVVGDRWYGPTPRLAVGD